MKNLIIILLSAVFIFCSCEGKRGPVGPEGEDLEIEIITGILSSADYDDLLWSIYTGILDLPDCVVNVRVRSDYFWVEPNWFMGNINIYIFDDHIADMGYEYSISIAH